METMRAQVVAYRQAPLPSAEVVSKVLSECSSNNTFLKNAGLSTPSSKSSPAREAALRRQLNAQKQSSAVLHEHLEQIKKTEAAEEVLERTASLFDELQKQEQESHLMLQKFGHVITTGIACQPWSCVSWSDELIWLRRADLAASSSFGCVMNVFGCNFIDCGLLCQNNNANFSE